MCFLSHAKPQSFAKCLGGKFKKKIFAPFAPLREVKAINLQVQQLVLLMRNFDYIKKLGFDELYRFCAAAEENQVSDPETSAFNARRAMEYMVRALFQMKNIPVGERTTLVEMLNREEFRTFIGDERVMMAAHYVRKVGNNAAHAVKVTRRESFFALLNLYNLVGAVLLKL